ncbi:MAG: hypothetical protein IKG93_02050 [Clostridiales bacterium]|nr:hypothetical protein [Clostridiales bacterium]
MKKAFKKIGALVISSIMIMSLSAAVFADGTTLDTNGEQGAFSTPDTPVSQNKTLVLSKEITAYNLDENSVKAPTISYTYTIAAATVANGTTVTDKADKHNSNTSVTVPVKAGVGTPTIANSGVVAWTNADSMTTSTGGTANLKDISIDFSSVVFTGAGVYRYAITEALTGATDTYAASGVTGTTGTHTRFIDVYVRPAETFTDGTSADDWDIYGFTCFYNNTSITDGDKTTGAVKTTGFVAGTSDGSTAVPADSYYTFNVIVSKTVVNDGYAAANTAFPFTVIMTNDTITKSIDVEGSTSGTVSDWTNPAAAALSAATTKGVVNIKSGGQVKYIGIPNGTSVEVYETNIVTGVTYKVDTAVTTNTTATTTDNSVTWTSTAPTTAAAQANPKQDYESTKTTIVTTADQDDDNAYRIAVTNTLVNISPTGVIIRVAPYALLLGAGVVLFILSHRGKRKAEEEA